MRQIKNFKGSNHSKGGGRFKERKVTFFLKSYGDLLNTTVLGILGVQSI